MYDLCCFGIVSGVQILMVERYPHNNSGTLVKDAFGGVTPDAAIVSVLAARLKLRTCMMTAGIGDDRVGREVSNLFREIQVDHPPLQSGSSTPWTTVICDSNGNRTWFSLLSPSQKDSYSRVDLSPTKDAKFVYIDLYDIIRQASLTAIEHAFACQTPTFVNLGGDSLSSDEADRLRCKVAIVQTSFEGSRADAEILAADLMMKIQPRLSIVTMGAGGSVCASSLSSPPVFIPAYRTTTLHSHGAGAAFSAGIIYSILNNRDLKSALRFASALAALFISSKSEFGLYTVELIDDYVKLH
ncbi:MAG TPA: carbohydrate kinase family protein [Tepidisphaeraceae bacterium]|jgi:sugar/nucleoside kinase (ribokinase family)|nr:carbohydrate kinase family protein [Tepidisphaeraceae bacterium]